MIATVQQIRMARVALRLSQAEVAARSGISATAFNDLETESSSPRAATLSAIQDMLEREGARFGTDGSVRIVPKTERFIVGPGQSPTPETLRVALAIVNSSHLLRLDEDER